MLADDCLLYEAGAQRRVNVPLAVSPPIFIGLQCQVTHMHPLPGYPARSETFRIPTAGEYR